MTRERRRGRERERGHQKEVEEMKVSATLGRRQVTAAPVAAAEVAPPPPPPPPRTRLQGQRRETAYTYGL